MQYTSNYNIPKYDATDLLNPTSREGINSGNDIIDNQLKTNADAIGTKANSSDVYAKSQTYSKTEVDTALGTKVGKSETYTSSEKKAICNTIGAEYFAEYELIDTITVGAETSSVSRTQTPNGTPYQFKKLWYVVTIPTSAKLWYGRRYVCTNKNAIRQLSDATSTSNAAYSSKVIYIQEVISGRIFARGCWGYGALHNTMGTFMSPNCMGLVEADYINEFFMDTYYTSDTYAQYIPQGTTIQIYGVWA